MRSHLTFDPSFNVKKGLTPFKGPKIDLLVLEGWGLASTYRKSGATDFFP